MSKWNGLDNWQVRFLWSRTNTFLPNISVTHTFDSRVDARKHIQELRKDSTVAADERISLVYVGCNVCGKKPTTEIY